MTVCLRTSLVFFSGEQLFLGFRWWTLGQFDTAFSNLLRLLRDRHLDLFKQIQQCLGDKRVLGSPIAASHLCKPHCLFQKNQGLCVPSIHLQWLRKSVPKITRAVGPVTTIKVYQTHLFKLRFPSSRAGHVSPSVTPISVYHCYTERTIRCTGCHYD